MPKTISLYTQIPNRLWSIIHTKTGMELCTVRGKRAKRSLLDALQSVDVCDDWREAMAQVRSVKANLQESPK